MSNDQWGSLAGKLSAAGVFYMKTDDIEQLERLCFEHGIKFKQVETDATKEKKEQEKTKEAPKKKANTKGLFKKKK